MNSSQFFQKVILVAATLLLPVIAGAQISGSKHDLSTAGGGMWGSTDETQICVFCHTPHNAASIGPLWNRAAVTASFTVYQSATLDAVVGQPGNESLLCMSCHDGVSALNMLLNPSPTQPAMDPAADQIGDIYYPGSPYGTAMNIGGSYPANPNVNDLSDDHPIGFVFDTALVSTDGALALPPANDAVKLRGAGGNRVECTTCHDVHDPTYKPFLVKPNNGSAICLTCHVK